MEVFDDTVYRPWWWEWAPRREARESALPGRADVVVVGSGYTGLVAALTLARAGRDVLVLEAEAIGSGASSRNGGQVGSGNQRSTVRAMIDAFGREKARALLGDGIAALEFVQELITAEGIECHLARVGRFRGASRPAHYEAMARDLDDLRALTGVESFMVPRAEQHAELGTDRYHGGSVLQGDAGLHPALYVDGLAARTQAAGASLVSHTPVTRLAREGDRVEVHTARGKVSARDVLVATNGYTGRATPELRPRVVPVGSAIIATAEISPNLMRHLMPRQRVVGDTVRVHHYYRPSPDGRRVLFGGRLAGRAGTARARDYAHLLRDMVEVFPELARVPITHAWSGYVAYTRQTLPHIGGADHVFHAMGYCGSGVARASYGGRKVALRILGDPAGATAWDDLPFAPYPFRSFSPIGVMAATGWKRFLDRTRG